MHYGCQQCEVRAQVDERGYEEQGCIAQQAYGPVASVAQKATYALPAGCISWTAAPVVVNRKFKGPTRRRVYRLFRLSANGAFAGILGDHQR